jgi:4-diphosphocytidyl-2-C-methyl-D-erythritol kinase
MTEPLSIQTPAKINLYLDVRGRRTDGYHEIETVFLPVPDLVDTLTLEPRTAAGIEIACAHHDVPANATNLVWKAATAFAQSAGVEACWRFVLEKRIPVAGGLGGGSSDAAAALHLLNQAHGCPLGAGDLHALAARLGADVAFFLDPRPAQAHGIGEQLAPIPCRARLPLLLINPGFPVATTWAYRTWSTVTRSPAPGMAALLTALAAGDAAAAAAATYNVFDANVSWKFPLSELLLAFLRRQPNCLAAHISGSGATHFAVCNPSSQNQIREAVAREFPIPLWFHVTSV